MERTDGAGDVGTYGSGVAERVVVGVVAMAARTVEASTATTDTVLAERSDTVSVEEETSDSDMSVEERSSASWSGPYSLPWAEGWLTGATLALGRTMTMVGGKGGWLDGKTGNNEVYMAGAIKFAATHASTTPWFRLACYAARGARKT